MQEQRKKEGKTSKLNYLPWQYLFRVDKWKEVSISILASPSEEARGLGTQTRNGSG